MNILYVTPEYENYGIARGIGTYVKAMAEQLASEGHFVLIVTLTMNKNLIGKKNFSENILIFGVYVPSYFKILIHLIYAIKLFFILPKLIKEYKIDIVESTDYAYPTVFYNFIKKVPVIIRLHTPGSYLLQFEKQNLKKKLYKIWLNFLEKINLKFSNILSSPSLALKDEVIKIFKLKKDIIVIPNGISLENEITGKEKFLSKKEESKTIFYLGGLSFSKGIDLLVKSCDLVFLKKPNVKCVIAGPNNLDISFDEFLKNNVHKKNLQRFIYLGPVFGKEKINLFSKATIFLFLSRWESFCFVILEAMKYGVPLIVLSNPAIKEILTEKEAVIISEENPQKISQEIIKLLEDKERRFYLTQNAKLRLKEFDIKKITDDMLKFYNQVIQKYGKKQTI